MPLAAAPCAAFIFADSFESGDVSAWSSAVGYPPATAFRATDLDLRDPHVFLDAGPFGCLDFTDLALPGDLVPSLNGSLEAAIGGDEDGDGLFDLSVLSIFRPLTVDTAEAIFESRRGECAAPPAAPGCDPAVDGTSVTTYSTADAGLCLTTVPGTTSGYSPGILEPAAPCFVTPPVPITVQLVGVELPLRSTRIAASFVGDPPTLLDPGLIAGFLAEADADSVTLPADLPIVGGQPLSIIFPGGTGNCAPGDDRDQLEGVDGWWLYLELVASPVPYSIP
ncbi:MAG: hypothetical protein AAGC60_22975 [Acidobacteriota bacterium]